METDGRKFWNQYAEKHDSIAYQFGEADADENRYPLYEIRRDYLLEIADQRKPGKVLDAGCGNGHILVPFLERGWDAQGIDFAEEMIGLAHKHLEAANHETDRAMVGDVTNLSQFEDDSFDLVYSMGVIEYLTPEQEAAMYSEVRRVLRPEGLFVTEYINALFDLVTYNRFTLDWWARDVLPEFFDQDRVVELRGEISRLFTNPDQPPQAAGDPMSTTRDQVYNMTQNPLTYGQHATELGFSLKDLIFYRFHAVPPLLFPQDRQLEHVPLENEKRLSRHWLGHFLASAFMGILTKNS